jgi:hypothetical protein
MALPEIEQRVATLEAEVMRLKEQVNEAVPSKGDWLDEIFGVFDNDPIYEEAMRLGREYRESLRPKTGSRSVRKAGKKSVKGQRR